uniref:Odorranain-C-RA2 peptide n=1 Tax=Odorrana andersonii TaxID=369514 RepID=E3SZB2_ODOAN|nr:odorranain-C-RA2 peptide precursor [Odorrana andersonii]
MFTLKKSCYSFSFLGSFPYLCVRKREMPMKKKMKKTEGKLKW